MLSRIEPQSLSFNPDGESIAIGGSKGSIGIWQWQNTNAALNIFEGKEQHTGAINSLSFSPGGSRLLSASSDGSIKLWSVSYHLLATLQGHTAEVSSAVFQPLGDDSIDFKKLKIVSASADRTIRIWNQENIPNLLMGHQGKVWNVEFSPSGRQIASADSDGTVRLWDADKGTEIKSFDPGLKIDSQDPKKLIHRFNVFDVSFSPDGRLLAAALEDGTVKIWNHPGAKSANNSSTKVLVNPRKDLKNDPYVPVLAIAFRPQPRSTENLFDAPQSQLQSIATGSLDGSIKLWTENGKLIELI